MILIEVVDLVIDKDRSSEHLRQLEGHITSRPDRTRGRLEVVIPEGALAQVC